MKSIILEGIATSGKSTVIEKVKNALKPGVRLRVVTEEETLMRIVENTDVLVSLEYLERLIDDVYAEQYDLVLFDRLHLSHVFRTSGNMGDFAQIEEKLLAHSPEIVFLEVQEQAIAERVKAAAEHRDLLWREYLSSKGENFDEIADYYIDQQRKQKLALTESKLPVITYNTTNHTYDAIVQDVVGKL